MPVNADQKAFAFKHEFPKMILGPAVDVFQNEWSIYIVIDQLPEANLLYESSELKTLSVTALIFDRLE